MPEITEENAVVTARRQPTEKIYDSPPSEPDDELWLTHGAKMLEDSVPSVRNAASALITELGLLQTAYLGILGFAKFIPEEMDIYKKALFVVPLVPWVFATYFCLRVMKTELLNINLRSPTDIRKKAAKLLEDKQRDLEIAFALLIAGIIMTFVMVVFRLRS
ncbi:MAG TPA: hypothetical protein VGP08_05530 [Pyrinomonadaceae bacterium]|jgi:hypothetical protein|nr:hypothetical protein [Pyrinomonadaceae bacterium]